VVQGVENGQHDLRLSGKGLKDVQAIKVYDPPLK
jgi:hypothetical protein